jgi:hypothetical protein
MKAAAFDDNKEGMHKMHHGTLKIINGQAAYLKSPLVQNLRNTSNPIRRLEN